MQDNDRTAAERIREARTYYTLCDAARALGVPVSLDDPDAPQTVRGLAESVVRAEQLAWRLGSGPFPLRAEILARYGLTA